MVRWAEAIIAALIAALARSGSERPRRTEMPLGSRNATSTKLCEIWCSAHESTHAAVCRSTRPPTTTTVVPGRATSVDATDRALIAIVSGRSAGSISAGVLWLPGGEEDRAAVG